MLIRKDILLYKFTRLKCSVAEKASAAPITQKKIYAVVVDVSGSTGSEFLLGMNVLEKEQECLMKFMLDNPGNDYYIYSFDSNFIFHGKCEIMVEEQFVQLPAMRPGSCTNTADPLLDICTKLNVLRPSQ